MANHMQDVTLHELQIPDLFPHKVRPDQSPGVFPVCAIGVEDAMSQRLDRGLSAQLSNVKIMEMRGQNSLRILRFVGKNQRVTHNLSCECRSNSRKSVRKILELIFPPAGTDGTGDKVKPENRSPVAIRFCKLAAMKTREFPRRDEGRGLTIGSVKEESSTETDGGEM